MTVAEWVRRNPHLRWPETRPRCACGILLNDEDRIGEPCRSCREKVSR